MVWLRIVAAVWKGGGRVVWLVVWLAFELVCVEEFWVVFGLVLEVEVVFVFVLVVTLIKILDSWLRLSWWMLVLLKFGLDC